MDYVKVKAIKCIQNENTFYIAVLDSINLKKMCFVSRKKENPIDGFQRLLNKKRAKDISNYLDNENGIIPSALILSAQKKAKIKFDSSTLILSFYPIKDSFLVIDGQHRLFGLFESKNEYKIPIVIFNDLSSMDEVKLFIDINTTQKGVPTALILDIKKQAGTETTIEERQRTLFNNLDKSSVLSGFLLPNESKTGRISRTVFNSSTKYIYDSSTFKDYTDEIIYKTVRNYLEALDFIFKTTNQKDARITKTIIFKATMILFNEICEKCLIKYHNLRVESFIDYLEPLKDLKFSEYTGTNKVTEKKITSDIKNLLKEKIHVNEDMF